MMAFATEHAECHFMLNVIYTECRK
jgi:hypothetical protein